MDIMHHTHTPPPPPPPSNKKHQKKKKNKGGGDESLKVVYISSPMKVRTSASRFRSLVQHLTGKNSDIAPYMDADGGALVDYRDDDGTLLPDHHRRLLSSVSSDDTTTTTTTTPATSDSLLGAVDNVFASQIDHQFGGFFSSESFCDHPSQMDVLGSYEDLLMM